jgi:epoxyqueuosine reductase QueG
VVQSEEQFREWLQDAAQRVGAHSACCIRLDHPALPAVIAANDQRVAAWLAAGKQGEMDYLERMLPQKSNPWQTFPYAKAVIVLTFTNGWGDPAATHPFPAPEPGAPVGYISSYAREIDYHARGQAMLAELHQLLGREVVAEAAVDCACLIARMCASLSAPCLSMRICRM